MKKTILFTALGVIFALCLQGQNFIQINKSNSGQTIQLAKDQVLEVMLPKTPSNGYTWCEQSTSDINKIQRSISEIGDGDFIHPDTKGAKMVGQSGTQIIRYVGTMQGTTVLTLELRRPWVKNGLPIDNYTITIVSAGKYTGKYTPPVKAAPVHTTSTPKSVPSKWDWRSQCTPIKNQNQCGDCWAYATVATLECNIKIHDNLTHILSEEFVTDCYTGQGSQGCNGGYCAHDCWLSTFTGANSQGGGAVYESVDATTCNNTGNTGTCKSGGYAHNETIDSHAEVPNENSSGIPPDADMKSAIYNYGPIWVGMDASASSFNNYSGGIWTVSGSSIDHAVCLVGWCDSASISGGGYWIMRNSWASDWGVNGYMYISYGSASIGTYADYIVYKGGISHAVAPVASFTASTTTSCTGTIQFTDASSNSPTTWAWTFGDGGTSTSQSPSHTYTTSGTYTITLKATNTYGNNTATQTNYITINLPAVPSVTNGTTTQGGSVTLHATGTGTLNWYDAATSGNIVNTGTSYTISPLNTNQTFYVENNVSSAAQSVGMSSSTLSTGGYYTSTARQGLIFDALTNITLNSVTVYANTTANRTIFLKNSSGTVIDSLVKSISSGTQTVALGWSIPAGTGYILGCSSNNSLWRETSGASYPYTATGLVSITGNTAGTSYPGYYYYFYNWQVTGAPCKSSRTPVTATILTGIDEYSQTNIEIFPNPNNGEFTIAINNIPDEAYKMVIVNTIGQEVYSESIMNTNNYNKTFYFKNLSKGIYSLKLLGKNSVLYKKMIIQ